MTGTTADDRRGEGLEAFRRALRREAHVLGRHPELTWPQLHNRLQWEAPVAERVADERARRTGPPAPPWLRTLDPLGESAQLIRLLAGHEGLIHAFAVAPNGSWIASGSQDYTLRIWEPGGRERAACRHAGQVRACAAAPDGSFVLAGGDDGCIYVWKPDGRLHAMDWGTHQDAHVSACAVAPDGSFFVSAADDGKVGFYSARTSPEHEMNGIRMLECTAVARHDSQVRTCVVAPDASFVASAGLDNMLRVWGRDGTALFVGRGHQDMVTQCAVAPDSSFVVSGAADAMVVIWRLDGGQPALCLGHEDAISDCAVAPDRSCVVSTSYDGTLRIWEPDGTPRAVCGGHGADVLACAFAPDGSAVATAGADATVRLWDLEGREQAVLRGHTGPARRCAFAADGSYLVSAGGSGEPVLRLWSPGTAGGGTDVAADAALRERALRAVEEPPPAAPFSVTADADGTMRLLRPDGSELAECHGHEGPVRAWAVAPGGSWLASAGKDKTLRLWTPDGRERAVCAHDGPVADCAIAADGSFVVSTATHGDDCLRIWSPAGELRAVLRGHEGAGRPPSGAAREAEQLGFGPDYVDPYATEEVLVCAISPDGALIVSGGEDHSVRLWDVASGAQLAVVFLPAPVTSLALHPTEPYAVCRVAGVPRVIELVGVR